MSLFARAHAGLVGGLLAGALLLAVSGTAMADDQVAAFDQPTPISAYGGQVVWSQQQTRGGRYFLTASSDGVTRRLPVASRPVPFDVDLGPGPAGGVSAVYSRCRRDAWSTGDPNSGLIAYAAPSVSHAGCQIYRFDFASGRERRLSALTRRGSSQTLPTIWGSDVAFVRVNQDKSGVRGVLPHLMYSRGGKPPREVRGGTPGLWQPVYRGSSVISGGPGPLALDLRDGTLAFSWLEQPSSCNGSRGGEGAEPLISEIWQVRPGQSRQRVARACNVRSGDQISAVFGASLSARGLDYFTSNGTKQPSAALVTASGGVSNQSTPIEDRPVAASLDDQSLYLLRQQYGPGPDFVLTRAPIAMAAR